MPYSPFSPAAMSPARPCRYTARGTALSAGNWQSSAPMIPVSASPLPPQGEAGVAAAVDISPAVREGHDRVRALEHHDAAVLAGVALRRGLARRRKLAAQVADELRPRARVSTAGLPSLERKSGSSWESAHSASASRTTCASHSSASVRNQLGHAAAASQAGTHCQHVAAGQYVHERGDGSGAYHAVFVAVDGHGHGLVVFHGRDEVDVARHGPGGPVPAPPRTAAREASVGAPE